MKIAIATCHTHPTVSKSDAIFMNALIHRDVTVSVLPWNDASYDSFIAQDAVILRSTWDYQDYPNEYVNWLNTLQEKEARVFNAPALAIWNNDKRHIIELAEAGFATPKTVDLSTHAESIAPASAEPIADLCKSIPGDEFVIKPIWGGDGVGVTLTTRATFARDIAELRLAVSDRPLMLQEYLPEIAHGELSQIFIDGSFAHAVLKVPPADEFRVNSQFGATKQHALPSQQVIDDALAILDWLPAPTLYARVDGVVRDGRLICTELELTDPSLMFEFSHESAEHMADATIEWLT